MGMMETHVKKNSEKNLLSNLTHTPLRSLNIIQIDQWAVSWNYRVNLAVSIYKNQSYFYIRAKAKNKI